MSDYPKRPPEMSREVAVLQEQAVRAEREGTGPPAVLATYVRLQAGIGSYAAWRDSAFASGLVCLIPDAGATAESQQRRWTEAFHQRGAEALRMLVDLVSRDEDPIERTFELMAMQESTAFAAIAAMPLAGFLGQVREHIRDLERHRDSLNDRWDELTGQNERVHQQIAALRQQVFDVFKEAVGAARGWAPKVEKAVGTVLFGWEKKEEPSPDPSLAPAVKATFDTVHLLQQTVESVARSAQGLYANEQTIHTLFGNARQQLKEYLERVSKYEVNQAWARACTATRDAAGRCPKDGQKEDARQLAEAAIRASGPVIEEYDDAFDAFYKHFEGRFTGEVSDKTVAALAEQELFNQFWKDIESLDLPGVFRAAADGIVRCEDVSLDRLTDDQRRRFQAIIHERVSTIEDQVRTLDWSFFDRFRLQFVDVPRRMAVDRLKRLVGYRT